MKNRILNGISAILIGTGMQLFSPNYSHSWPGDLFDGERIEDYVGKRMESDKIGTIPVLYISKYQRPMYKNPLEILVFPRDITKMKNPNVITAYDTDWDCKINRYKLRPLDKKRVSSDNVFKDLAPIEIYKSLNRMILKHYSHLCGHPNQNI